MMGDGMCGISTRCGRRTGFTLIEMLLVLSVFSLLIGRGVPRLIGWVGWNRQVQAMERLGRELSSTGRTAIAAAAPLGLRAMPNRRGLEWIQGIQEQDGDWRFTVLTRLEWPWGGVAVERANGGVLPGEVRAWEAEELESEWLAEDIIWWDMQGLTNGGTVRMAGRSGGEWIVGLSAMAAGDMVVRYEP